MSACASCGRAVRNYGGRTVCDGCCAVLIPHAGFVELFRGDVDLVDDNPTQRQCPRCTSYLRACRITIDGVDLDHDTLYCRDHGVWLAGGLLEHILYATERESHRDFPGPRGTSHFGPGLGDLERAEARTRAIATVRSWCYIAAVCLGIAFSLAAVVAAGWWCVAILAATLIGLRWWMARRPDDGERALALRPQHPAAAAPLVRR